MLFYRLCILNIFVVIKELDDLNLLILCVRSDKISHFSRYMLCDYVHWVQSSEEFFKSC